jgi:hypothetical protein
MAAQSNVVQAALVHWYTCTTGTTGTLVHQDARALIHYEQTVTLPPMEATNWQLARIAVQSNGLSKYPLARVLQTILPISAQLDLFWL